jgi:hypothetical protein
MKRQSCWVLDDRSTEAILNETGVDSKRGEVVQRKGSENCFVRVFFLVREIGGHARRYPPMSCPDALSHSCRILRRRTRQHTAWVGDGCPKGFDSSR